MHYLARCQTVAIPLTTVVEVALKGALPTGPRAVFLGVVVRFGDLIEEERREECKEITG